MKKANLILLFLLSTSITFSQSIIKGKLVDQKKTPIPNANVLLKELENKKIIDYTYTNFEGEYSFITEKKGDFLIEFSSLGYKQKSIIVNLNQSKEINNPVILEEEIFSLDEVHIKLDVPIKIKKDTIIFSANKFATGNEQVVEDLLKKIPGLNINEEGTIKVGNKEIEKLMVDGEDFFEHGYKILSKNMPVHPIDKIEILQNYSNNHLLKNIEASDKVALNLKLKTNTKAIWFGNIKIGSNFTDRYELQGNLMNFGKKNKFYFLSNLNNIGKDVTGDINHLIRDSQFNEPASIGNNHQANNLINLFKPSLNFKRSRINFNDVELLSLNAIFNPTKKIKIKTIGFFNWDEQRFFRNTVDNISVNGTSFTNTENYKLRNQKKVTFGKIDFTYNISKTKRLEINTKYNNGNKKDESNLVFNGTPTIENLQFNNTLFDQKISYSNKFKEKKVFLLTGRFIDEEIPQHYSINQFFYTDLFPSFTNATNVQQQSNNQMHFAGIEAHLLNRKINGDLLELQFGNEFRNDRLRTTFTLLENNTILESPNGFQNNSKYITNNLYFKTKYRYKIKDFAVTGKLGLHQLINKLEFDDFSGKQNYFFLNPSIGLEWKIDNQNKIISSYAYNTTNASILDVYNNYALTGFRSFSKGAGTFNQLNASSLLVNYQLGNWSDRFFANTYVFYNKNFDFFSSNTLINQNFTQSERIVVKDRELLTFTTKLDYYFKKISSNLKLDVGFSKSNYKNIVNNSNLREVISNNFNYGLELRSGFNGVFNYHIGTKWSTNKIKTATSNNAFTNNVSFLDLSFIFNEKFNIQFQSEGYFFGNHDKDNNSYYFLDFDSSYTIIKNKLTIALIGKNLLNTETFKTYSIDDIGTTTTEYRLLPRYALLKMKYRF